MTAGNSDAIREQYLEMSNEELLRLTTQKSQLLDDARRQLETEMQRRGLDDTTVAGYQEREQKIERTQQQARILAKSERATRRLESFKRFGILMAAAIASTWTAAQIFNLPGEEVRIMTQMPLSFALALFFLTGACGGSWRTVRRTLLIAILIPVGVLGLVVWAIATSPVR